MAFHRLASGNTNGFDYALWVGFGDDWRQFRSRLTDLGYIRATSQHAPAHPTQKSADLCAALQRESED